MVSRPIRRFLEPLDDIETRARRTFGHCTSLYMHYILQEFMRYWRELEQQGHPELKGKAIDELCFFFDQKLRDIAFARFQMEWMIYEYDGEDLYPIGHEPGPFWRKRK
ncbi:hypothetical protein [Motiliproteus sp.]|uniref:hypothetical protein n=1 Tax=Motiliproteus sp. TaxID=1898955 RepID=UPI003BAA2E9C